MLVFKDRDTPGTLHRVSTDDWQIDACPHHGPSVAIGAGGTIHAAWFTFAKARQGVFYGRSIDGGEHFTTPLLVGGPDRHAGRPYLAADGKTVRLVWKEFDGETTSVKLMTSPDNGNSWSEPKELATTADASDHPLLSSDGRRSYLSWLTRAEGFRLIPLDDGP